MSIRLVWCCWAVKVDWEEEQACFESVANELAGFYADFSAYSEVASDMMEQEEEEEDRGADPAAATAAEAGAAAAPGGAAGAKEAEADTGPVPKKYERLLQVG